MCIFRADDINSLPQLYAAHTWACIETTAGHHCSPGGNHDFRLLLKALRTCRCGGSSCAAVGGSGCCALTAPWDLPLLGSWAHLGHLRAPPGAAPACLETFHSGEPKKLPSESTGTHRLSLCAQKIKTHNHSFLLHPAAYSAPLPGLQEAWPGSSRPLPDGLAEPQS